MKNLEQKLIELGIEDFKNSLIHKCRSKYDIVSIDMDYK